jgi:5-methyltetrahydrofolate--homocysteine methyltransferase
MLVSARSMKGGLGFLKPYLVESGVEPVAKVAIGTVKGDLHDIGKNLVAMMLEGAGFEIDDLGVDVSIEQFVGAVGSGAHILGLSALLTTTMPQMPIVIEALRDSGWREKVKVIIGGAPVTQAYADQIGADGFAADASSVAPMVRTLIPEAVEKSRNNNLTGY